MEEKKNCHYMGEMCLNGMFPKYSMQELEAGFIKRKFLSISIDGEWFKDNFGRTLILRGANLTAKTPVNPDLPHRDVSFIGKPFPLEEAKEHFARLSFLGFNLLRFSVNWEAIEHKGPGEHDEAYLDYLEKMIELAEVYGHNIFIDFHQDVWSRFTGGDGAPGWTLEMCGFHLPNLEESGATILHNRQEGTSHHLLWPTNAYKLGASTMFTLFFGGKTFAPNKRIEGESIQDFLQNRYIAMAQKVVKRTKRFKSVIGFDLMNEPQKGYIGVKKLDHVHGLYQLGASPTPFEGMALGDGNSLEVGYWEKRFLGMKNVGKQKLNLAKKRAWQEGIDCVWKDHNIWDYDKNGNPTLLNSRYFYEKEGRKWNFENDFYKPFLIKLGNGIHRITPSTFLFIENVVGSKPPNIEEEELKHIVFTGHWYDAFVLATKRFFSFIAYDMMHMKSLIGLPTTIRKSFARQVGKLKHFAKETIGKVPTLISEFGIPLDLRDKKAYKTGDFSLQNKALNRSFTAIDDNLSSATVWNYNPHNENSIGDGWNDEDLSIFSKDQHFDPEDSYSGLRAREALIRPYAKKVAGEPLYMHFEMEKGRFDFVFRHDPKVEKGTKIFLPHLHYNKGFCINVSDGTYRMDYERQILTYYHTEHTDTHCIQITKKA